MFILNQKNIILLRKYFSVHWRPNAKMISTEEQKQAGSSLLLFLKKFIENCTELWDVWCLQHLLNFFYTRHVIQGIFSCTNYATCKYEGMQLNMLGGYAICIYLKTKAFSELERSMISFLLSDKSQDVLCAFIDFKRKAFYGLTRYVEKRQMTWPLCYIRNFWATKHNGFFWVGRFFSTFVLDEGFWGNISWFLVGAIYFFFTLA